jgi:hypothetical protein
MKNNYQSIDDLDREAFASPAKQLRKKLAGARRLLVSAIEEDAGIDKAMDYDREAWRRFTVVEAVVLSSFSIYLRIAE